MLELRPYQQDAVDAMLGFIKEPGYKKRPLVVAPTAAGKSVIIGHVAHAVQDGVLVLQPSKELLEQNYAKFKLYGGQASVYSASLKEKEVSATTFATIGSVVKVPYLFEHVRVILIDEGHEVPPKEKSMYVQFLSCFEKVKVIGLTATAFRLKKYRDRFTQEPYSQINLLPRERPKFFNDFLHVTQIADLYEQGYLCPIKYLPLAWDNGMLRYNSTGADFDDGSVERAMQDQAVVQRIPSVVTQALQKGRKHVLVFVRDVATAEMLSRTVPGAAYVCAMTKPAERAAVLEGFRCGAITTVFNVGVLTTGFDFPELDAVVIGTPTKSLALYMQMVGRGIRQAPGKEDCAVVDMCGNIARFGRIEDIRYEKDPIAGWVLCNAERQLSGVRLST